MYICKQLPSNQSFDKLISSHQKGGGVSRWGEWVGWSSGPQLRRMYHIRTLCVCVCDSVCVLFVCVV